MGYRNIYIKHALHMSYKHCSLILEKEDDVIEIPLEDIATILLEDHKTTITSALISELAKNYIVLIMCDKRYLPCSMMIPIHTYYRELKVFNQQLDAKKTMISQLWSFIVSSKIKNQMSVLEICKCDQKYIEMLKEICKKIKAGDKTNREAVAAKIFFHAMYGSTFIRNHNSEDAINMALNYGYSIMAAHMTRVLTLYGFHTMIGLHHDSKTNNFNLAYDFVEPFRSLVDLYVYKHKDEIFSPLSKEIRYDLINLTQETVILEGKNYSVQNAMEEIVLSFKKCLQKQNSSLLVLPSIKINEKDRDNELQIDESSSSI